VLAHVGQRLLHDPVHGQRLALGHRPGHAGHGEGHRQSGRTGLPEQLAELVDAGLRGQLRAGREIAVPAARVAEHAEQRPHLG
jgi:hypothetical protein